MDEVFQSLVNLFIETGRAHHQAFLDSDGFDPEWPLWYADYLKGRLATLLEASLTKSELVYLLVSVDREQAAEAPGVNWAKYYARFFIDRYMPGE